MTKRPIMVWSEIPVSNLEKSCQFYASVFDWEMKIEDMGPNKVANFNNSEQDACGHLYPGNPAEEGAGSTIHLCVPDNVEDASARCEKAGGKIVSPIIEIPPGRFAYALDPDGNSIGLFEAK